MQIEYRPFGTALTDIRSAEFISAPHEYATAAYDHAFSLATDMLDVTHIWRIVPTFYRDTATKQYTCSLRVMYLVPDTTED